MDELSTNVENSSVNCDGSTIGDEMKPDSSREVTVAAEEDKPVSSNDVNFKSNAEETLLPNIVSESGSDVIKQPLSVAVSEFCQSDDLRDSESIHKNVNNDNVQCSEVGGRCSSSSAGAFQCDSSAPGSQEECTSKKRSSEIELESEMTAKRIRTCVEVEHSDTTDLRDTSSNENNQIESVDVPPIVAETANVDQKAVDQADSSSKDLPKEKELVIIQEGASVNESILNVSATLVTIPDCLPDKENPSSYAVSEKPPSQCCEASSFQNLNENVKAVQIESEMIIAPADFQNTSEASLSVSDVPVKSAEGGMVICQGNSLTVNVVQGEQLQEPVLNIEFQVPSGVPKDFTGQELGKSEGKCGAGIGEPHQEVIPDDKTCSVTKENATLMPFDNENAGDKAGNVEETDNVQDIIEISLDMEKKSSDNDALQNVLSKQNTTVIKESPRVHSDVVVPDLVDVDKTLCGKPDVREDVTAVVETVAAVSGNVLNSAESSEVVIAEIEKSDESNISPTEVKTDLVVSHESNEGTVEQGKVVTEEARKLTSVGHGNDGDMGKGLDQVNEVNKECGEVQTEVMKIVAETNLPEAEIGAAMEEDLAVKETAYDPFEDMEITEGSTASGEENGSAESQSKSGMRSDQSHLENTLGRQRKNSERNERGSSYERSDTEFSARHGQGRGERKNSGGETNYWNDAHVPPLYGGQDEYNSGGEMSYSTNNNMRSGPNYDPNNGNMQPPYGMPQSNFVSPLLPTPGSVLQQGYMPTPPGYMPPPGYCGPTPPQGYNGPFPPQGFGGPTPPQGFGGPTPPQGFGGPTPPQGFGGPTPPQGFGGPTPPQGFGGPTPPQDFSGQCPPFGGMTPQPYYNQWGQWPAPNSGQTQQNQSYQDWYTWWQNYSAWYNGFFMGWNQPFGGQQQQPQQQQYLMDPVHYQSQGSWSSTNQQYAVPPTSGNSVPAPPSTSKASSTPSSKTAKKPPSAANTSTASSVMSESKVSFRPTVAKGPVLNTQSSTPKLKFSLSGPMSSSISHKGGAATSPTSEKPLQLNSILKDTVTAEKSDQDMDNSLWVGNLPLGTCAVDVRSLISKHGKVVKCKVGSMKSQKDAGLFALVTMETPEDVAVCIQMLHESHYKGQKILVRKLKQQ